MANELQRITDDYYDRNKALVMEYRDYMGKQVEAVGAGITNSLDNVARMQQAQIITQVASTAVLNQTLQQGFTGISNQLGSMTASFSMGFARLENALDRMTDAINNPLSTQSRELYSLAADRAKKGQFKQALKFTQDALDMDETDYTSWFLQGKIYAFGANKYGNVIDIDKSIDALTKAAEFNEPNIAESADALKRQAEIYFYLGIAYYVKSNDQFRENKMTESSDTLALARKSFEQSYQHSNGMLESLFNIARCKVIQGETDGALRDLEKLVLRERNYCVKVCADYDFASIGEQFTSLINKLKKPVFISAKNDYDRINTLLSELTALGGRTNEKVPSSFSETLPYFDILYYADDFKRIIPIVQKAITDRKAAIAKAEQEARDAKEEAARKAKDAKEKAEKARKEQEWRKEQAQQEREREEKRKRARRNRILLGIVIGLAAGAGIGKGFIFLSSFFPVIEASDSIMGIFWAIAGVTTLITAIVVTVKNHKEIGFFFGFFFGFLIAFLIAGVIIYNLGYLLFGTSDIPIVSSIFVGVIAIVGAVVGALTGAKK